VQLRPEAACWTLRFSDSGTVKRFAREKEREREREEGGKARFFQWLERAVSRAMKIFRDKNVISHFHAGRGRRPTKAALTIGVESARRMKNEWFPEEGESFKQRYIVQI